MKYKLLEKAYQIDFSQIEEGYLYCEMICYVENRNQAKSRLLSKLRKDYETLISKKTDKEVDYLSIPVIRCKEADKYEFEGQSLTIQRIEEILSERERINALDEILNDESIEFCYIKKGSYYRPNSCGYTDYRIFAGVYPKNVAVSHAKGVREISVIPINIDEHNLMIEKEINELRSRLIGVDAVSINT